MIIKTNNWSLINKQVSKLDCNPSHDDTLESSKDFQSLNFLSHEEKINKLEGHTGIVTSSNGGSITWKVVKEVTNDKLKVARELNEDYLSQKIFL